MPTIPFDPNPTVAPAGAPGVFERVDAGPEHFGALQGQAESRLGQSAEQLGDVTAQAAIRQQQQYNETATDQGNTQYDGLVRPVVGNFRTLRGADALAARPDTLAQIEDLRQQVRDTMKNPEQRRMFDFMSRRTSVRYLDEVEFHASTENKVWQGDTAVGAITNEVNNSATYWNDTPRFAESLGNIKIQADKLSLLKGVDPASDAGRAAVTHYTSEAWQARIRSVAAQDPDLARQLFDANADQMDASHRATLDQQLTSQQWTRMMRDDTLQRRADGDAARTLATTQAATLAQLTGNVLGGKPVDAASIADLVRTQQLAPHAAEFLIGLSRRPLGAVEDRPGAVIALHQQLSDPSLSVDDRMRAISGAAKSGVITATTAGSLVDAAYKRDQHVETQVEREARGTVLAAAGVPDGMVNISHNDAQRKAAVMSEWTDRVVRGQQDPIAVRNDMVPRYMPPGIPPVTWPRSQFGTIASTADAQKIAQQAKAAADTGQITPEQYQAEKTNILRFAGFYQKIDAARAAASQAPSAKKPQQGDKAKLRGAVPAEGS